MWAGDVVTLGAKTAASVGLADPLGRATVNVGAGDAVWGVGNRLDFNVGLTGGAVIQNFAVGDTLHLASSFANAAAFLAATSQNPSGLSVTLDAAGDSLALYKVDLATFTSMVNSGAVTFKS